jgi:hypothetical protein
LTTLTNQSWRQRRRYANAYADAHATGAQIPPTSTSSINHPASVPDAAVVGNYGTFYAKGKRPSSPASDSIRSSYTFHSRESNLGMCPHTPACCTLLNLRSTQRTLSHTHTTITCSHRRKVERRDAFLGGISHSRRPLLLCGTGGGHPKSAPLDKHPSRHLYAISSVGFSLPA